MFIMRINLHNLIKFGLSFVDFNNLARAHWGGFATNEVYNGADLQRIKFTMGRKKITMGADDILTSTSTLVIRKESSDSSHECIILDVIHHVLIKNICTCAVTCIFNCSLGDYYFILCKREDFILVNDTESEIVILERL